MGSTAVPGQAAKPVIDVDLTVADSSAEGEWLPQLEAVGFELVIREPWARAPLPGPRRSTLQPARVLAGLPRADPAPDLPRLAARAPPGHALYEQTKLRAAAESRAAGEHVMDHNARKRAVLRETYDRAFRAAGLLPQESQGPHGYPAGR